MTSLYIIIFSREVYSTLQAPLRTALTWSHPRTANKVWYRFRRHLPRDLSTQLGLRSLLSQFGFASSPCGRFRFLWRPALKTSKQRLLCASYMFEARTHLVILSHKNCTWPFWAWDIMYVYHALLLAVEQCVHVHVHVLENVQLS